MLSILDYQNVVATLQCGGDQPYFEGSVVKLKGDDCEYVIRAFESEKSVRLMRDVIGDVAYFPNVPIDSIVEHVLKTYEVLGSAGTGRSFTKMSVPPLRHAKQLWLRNERAYSPDWREMLALLELEETILDPLPADPAVTDDQLAEIVGDMLSMRMAEAMADRSVTRAEQYETATRLDVAVASGDLTFEARVAKTFPAGCLHLSLLGVGCFRCPFKQRRNDCSRLSRSSPASLCVC